ncbi:uncharacterized protein LOC5501963 [Nematostella vectensis]|uniref:uncharacterized protein LOC5501963 n=1 Tax=Nematostella vectensis TaxID=45351 RepID=UPI00138FC0FA|nr:uncharacterized protein LOC5501963 [Nematostella vectensis]
MKRHPWSVYQFESIRSFKQMSFNGSFLPLKSPMATSKIVLSIILLLWRYVNADVCDGFFKMPNSMLKGHVIETITATEKDCRAICRRNSACNSINYIRKTSQCELNSDTHFAFPEHFIPGRAPDAYYAIVKPVTKCSNMFCSSGMTCKMREGGKTYKCEDLNECETSDPCHVNATCTNTVGSYECLCKPGFNGDGFTCSGKVFLNSSSILMNASSLTLNYTRDLHTFLAPVLSSPTSSWRRCWHASSDGWAASKFRFLCEDKGPTVTIVEVGQYVFGGYADKPWTGCNCRVSSSKAFLFTLYNTQGYKPDKMLLKSTPDTSAIGDFSSAGPDFGRGSDLVIANNANSNRLSYTFPHSYHLPSGCTLNTCLAGSGSLYFTPSDVEVFYEVP